MQETLSDDFAIISLIVSFVVSFGGKSAISDRFAKRPALEICSHNCIVFYGLFLIFGTFFHLQDLDAEA